MLLIHVVANTILLVSGALQAYGAIWGFFFPKIFCIFWTHALDKLVTPLPILQIINLVCGILIIAMESNLLKKESFIRRSMLFRANLYLTFAVPAFINYQTTDVAAFLLLGTGLLIWGYCTGESIHLKPILVKTTDVERG